jgi:hypothetical protein
MGAFGQALLAACNAAFTGGAALHAQVATDAVAHTVWNTVKLRPVAKKEGDATLTGAYRGIGIQTALARLLAMLVLQRLAPAVERAGLLSRSQAGFRNREEAVAQAAALLEICGRRRAAGLNTYLLFITLPLPTTWCRTSCSSASWRRWASAGRCWCT